MKKVILSMVLLFAFVVSFAANSFNNLPSSDIEDFGCASDCVSTSRDLVLGAAADNGDDPNSDPIYMQTYLALYESCYYNNCV